MKFPHSVILKITTPKKLTNELHLKKSILRQGVQGRDKKIQKINSVQ